MAEWIQITFWHTGILWPILQCKEYLAISKYKGTFSGTLLCLCFDAVGLAAGRAPGLKKTKWWDARGPADATGTHYLLLQ